MLKFPENLSKIGQQVFEILIFLCVLCSETIFVTGVVVIYIVCVDKTAGTNHGVLNTYLNYKKFAVFFQIIFKV